MERKSKYTETFRELWSKIFASFDKDDNGRVDQKEMLQMQKRVNATKLVELMEEADFNEDDSVTLEEWTSMFDLYLKKFGTDKKSYLACLQMFNIMIMGEPKSSNADVYGDITNDDEMHLLYTALKAAKKIESKTLKEFKNDFARVVRISFAETDKNVNGRVTWSELIPKLREHYKKCGWKSMLSKIGSDEMKERVKNEITANDDFDFDQQLNLQEFANMLINWEKQILKYDKT